MTQSGGELDLVGVELEKCGGEHGIRWGGNLKGRTRQGAKAADTSHSVINYNLVGGLKGSQSATIVDASY